MFLTTAARAAAPKELVGAVFAVWMTVRSFWMAERVLLTFLNAWVSCSWGIPSSRWNASIVAFASSSAVLMPGPQAFEVPLGVSFMYRLNSSVNLMRSCTCRYLFSSVAVGGGDVRLGISAPTALDWDIRSAFYTLSGSPDLADSISSN